MSASKIPPQLEVFRFVRVRDNEKAAVDKAWGLSPLNHEQISHWLAHHKNYGVVMGYGNNIAIDFDDPELYSEKISQLPDTFTVKTPKKGFHCILHLSDTDGVERLFALRQTKVISLGRGQKHLGELRIRGVYIMGPGSIHPDTGTSYEVYNNVPIADISVDDLLRVFSDVLPPPKSSNRLTSVPFGRSMEHLAKISGIPELKGEVFTFHENHDGTHQVVVNEKSTGAWIDHHGYIGSHTNGGPTVIQWVMYYGHDYTAAVSILKKYGVDFYDAKDYNPNTLADYILRGNKIIFAKEKLYSYGDGYYQVIDQWDIRKQIKQLLGISFKTSKANETIFSLCSECVTPYQLINSSDLLNLNNGLLDLSGGHLISHTPSVISTIRFPVSYEKEAKCPTWEATVSDIFDNDQNKIRTLQEFFGYCLTKDTKYHKMLYLVGDGRNGKSVVLYVLQNLLGRDNYSSISLDSFDNYHVLAQLEGKIANICGEVKAKSSVCDNNFKLISSGDPINIDPKNKEGYTITPICKMIFATNELPRVEDRSDGFYDRLLILRFEKQYKDDDSKTNPDLKFQIVENEINGVFQWALKGLANLRSRGKFLRDEYMRQAVQQYRDENTPVLMFAQEACAFSPLSEVSINDLYMAYVSWCAASGHRSPMSKTKFGQDFFRHFRTTVKKDTIGPNDNRERGWLGVEISSSFDGQKNRGTSGKKDDGWDD